MKTKNQVELNVYEKYNENDRNTFSDRIVQKLEESGYLDISIRTEYSRDIKSSIRFGVPSDKSFSEIMKTVTPLCEAVKGSDDSIKYSISIQKWSTWE